MKRIICLLITAFFCLCLFSGCGARVEGAPDGMKALTSDDKLDYNIYVPVTWVQDLSTGAVSAYAGASDLSNISMTQFNLDEMKKLDEHVADYIEDLEENLKDFKLEEGYPEKGATLLNGVEAKKIEYTATLAGNQYKYMQIICSNGGTIYFFTYTAMADAYDSHTEEVQQILDNFTFKKK